MTMTRLDAAVARWETLSGLRRWAEGSLTDQAAVELLASWSAGCFIRPGAAWVRPCRAAGYYALNGDALAAEAATRAGDERRVLRLAAALVNGDRLLPRLRANRRRTAA
jgi:acetoin utilization deacetylase AcuC-like enzyme